MSSTYRIGEEVIGLVGLSAPELPSITTTDADGNPIHIVNVDGDYKYLGRLVVEFDAMGRVLPESINDQVSGVVRTEETNLGNLTADSLKWYTERCNGTTNVIALKNGGGIRAEIGDAVVVGTETTLNPPVNVGLPTAQPGDVSEGHMRGTLRFDNGATVLTVSGVELKTLLEYGVADSGPGRTPGRFPQVAGISFSYDVSQTAQALT